MELKKDAKYVIGVDLGGTNVRAAVVDRNGKILGEGRTDSKAMDGLDVTVAQTISAIRLAISKSPADISEIGGAGMGVEVDSVLVERHGRRVATLSRKR